MPDKIFKLFSSPLSANGRKVLALAYHLQLDITIELVNVYQGEGQTPDYLKLNPFGKIPTLVDGDFVLWESNAILQYLAEQGTQHRLYSHDVTVKGDIARWLFWEAAHWQPAVSTVVGAVVGHEIVPQYVPAPAAPPNWQAESFRVCADYLNTHLSQHDFLSDNRLTIADFSVAGMMTYFRFAKFPFDEYPHIKAWYEKTESLSAWEETAVAPWKRQ